MWLRWLVWRDQSKYPSKYRPRDILQNLMSGVLYYKALNLCRSNSSCFLFVLKIMISVLATLIVFFIWKTLRVLQKTHIKVVAGATCVYLFFLYIQLLLLWKVKICLIFVFLSKLEKRPLFNDLNCKTILVWGLVSRWLRNATHCL